MEAKKKGLPPVAGKGRPKGAKNKFTKDLKTAYLEAFERRGGVRGLLDWAEKSPDVFYSQISRMLPKDLQINSENQLVINVISAIPEPKPLPALENSREATS